MSIKQYQTAITRNILKKYKPRNELLLNTIKKIIFLLLLNKYCGGTVKPLCSGHHGDRGFNYIAGISAYIIYVWEYIEVSAIENESPINGCQTIQFMTNNSVHLSMRRLFSA